MAPETTFGREAELDLLDDLLDRAERDGAALVLAGPEGIGKSHLLRAASASAAARGFEVRACAGVPFEAELRFAGLNQLLLPWHHELEHLGARRRDLLEGAVGLGAADVGDVDEVAEAVVGLVDRLTRARPVLVVVDDLHWFDPSSRAVVDRLSRAATGRRLGLLASLQRSTASRHLDATWPFERVLHPLDGSAALDLVTSSHPGIDGLRLRRVLDEAQGHPMLLQELAGSPTGGRPAQAPPAGPRPGNVIASQLLSLPSSTRAVLVLAALSDQTATPDLTVSLDLDTDELGRLAPAVQQGLVELEPGTARVRFSNGLVRRTVVALATTAERRWAHRLLAQRDPRPDGRVRHLAHVVLEPDAELASRLERAARRSLQRGNARGALEVLRHSADLSPRRSDRARRLAHAAYVGVDLAGDLPVADTLLAEARELDLEVDGSLRAAAAEAALLLNQEGDVDAAHRRLVAALESHPHRSDPIDDQLLDALHLLAAICAHGGRPELWRPLHARLARYGRHAPPLLVLLTDLQSSLPPLGPPGTQALELVEGQEQVDDPRTVDRRASVALAADRPALVRNAGWRAAHPGRAGGSSPAAFEALAALAADSFTAGRWDESCFLAHEGRRSSELHGYELPAQGFRLDHALVQAVRGRDDAAARTAAAVAGWAGPRGARLLQLRCHRIRALAALGRGDFEEAFQHGWAVSPAAVGPGCPSLAVEVSLDLAEAAIRTNRRPQAEAHLAAVRAAGSATLSPRQTMISIAAAGVAASGDEAAHHFARALSVDGAEQWPFDTGRVRLAYGERLRRLRAPTEARPHLQAALATFSGLGADPWVARARLELEAIANTKGRTAFGVDSLTPQEREVARLAAAGLSNRGIAEQLFISPRTVGAHLHHVFPKLGISTRAALRDALDTWSVGA